MGLSRSHLDINRTEQMRETSEIVTHMPHCVQNSALPLFLNECSVKKDSLFLSHVDRYTFLLTVNTSIYIHFFFSSFAQPHQQMFFTHVPKKIDNIWLENIPSHWNK